MSLLSTLAGLPAAGVYAAVAGLVGVESIGIPVPGETGLITAALITTHPAARVTLLGVFLAAWAGAVIGDNIGYAAGRRYGPRLFTHLGERFPHQFSPAHVAYAGHLFQRHGASTVFIARFVALLRMLAGPLAGSLHLAYPRFLLANVAGGAAWAGGITALVGLLGAAAHRWATGVGWVLLVVVALIALVSSRRLHRAFERRVAEFAREQEQHPG